MPSFFPPIELSCQKRSSRMSGTSKPFRPLYYSANGLCPSIGNGKIPVGPSVAWLSTPLCRRASICQISAYPANQHIISIAHGSHVLSLILCKSTTRLQCFLQTNLSGCPGCKGWYHSVEVHLYSNPPRSSADSPFTTLTLPSTSD